MNYTDWLTNQVRVHGRVEKPIHYKIAQYRTMQELVGMSGDWLDVGCGTGEGMLFLHCFGANRVYGIDVNTQKIEVAQKLGLDAEVGDIEFCFEGEKDTFDGIWCSHAFEHMRDPEAALEAMKKLMKKDGFIYFILPYVDTGDPKAHCASFEIGTRIDDGGQTVIKWFEDRGLILIDYKLDDFREPEIWLEFKKV